MIAMVAVSLALTLVSVASGASADPSPTPSRQVLDPEQRLDQVIQKAAGKAGHQNAGVRLDNFKLVAHSALDGFGDYGDLYAHGDFAYVGSRCGAQHLGGDGVQVSTSPPPPARTW
jgi:hypothetical protein